MLAEGIQSNQNTKKNHPLKVFDAIAIDARRREDDTPWDETKEVITKNTPFFGFLCMQKNNNYVGYKCSDYKVNNTADACQYSEFRSHKYNNESPREEVREPVFLILR